MTSSNIDYAKALGSRILSEANDLKRTPEALANELNLEITFVQSVIEGKASIDDAIDVLKKMAAAYPVSLSNIWIDDDDTHDGVSLMRASESAATSRVFSRHDPVSGMSPYYEYRDTAMSRFAPFKPEWIRELRVVHDNDADNPNVVYNNGHLMHQCTFFIGPVNFYYRIGDQSFCQEMNTGDSNYITPFVPHSFASRSKDEIALIIAITFGGEVRRSLNEFSRLSPTDADALAGDAGDKTASKALIGRYLAAEMIDEPIFQKLLINQGIPQDVVRSICSTGIIPPNHLSEVGAILNVRPSDLSAAALDAGPEVVVTHAQPKNWRPFPDANQQTYRITPLTRTMRQPLMKGFDFRINSRVGASLKSPLHQYVYNYGDKPISISWGDGHQDTISSGDSAYIAPYIAHSFGNNAPKEDVKLLTMGVPGGISDASLLEFSTFEASGRQRAIRENSRWF